LQHRAGGQAGTDRAVQRPARRCENQFLSRPRIKSFPREMKKNKFLLRNG